MAQHGGITVRDGPVGPPLELLATVAITCLLYEPADKDSRCRIVVAEEAGRIAVCRIHDLNLYFPMPFPAGAIRRRGRRHA